MQKSQILQKNVLKNISVTVPNRYDNIFKHP